MDWIQFLEDHSIPYVNRGPNTRRGEVSVRCPFCGDNDPSEHLSISLSKDAWACWRNAEHRGRAPHPLIAALLGTLYGPAKALAKAYSHADPGSLGQALASLTRTSGAPKPVTGHEVITYPPEFRPIQLTGSTARFARYLASRHFDDVEALVTRYQLQCCMIGPWKDRIIVPLHSGGLVGWTGRAITATISAPRYLTSSDVVKKIVFNEDELQAGGEVLFLVEGPFDALKLDYYGQPQVRATCGFGVNLSIDQIAILSGLRPRFRKLVILFDQGAIGPAFAALDWLQGPNVSLGALPEGVKDPGALSRAGAVQLMDEHLWTGKDTNRGLSVRRKS